MRVLGLVLLLCMVGSVAAKPKTQRELLVEKTDKMFDDADRLADEGDFAGSLKVSEEMLAMRIKGLGPDAEETSDAHERVGVTLKELGRFDDAQRHLERALAIREKLAPGSTAVSTSLHNLGKLADERGQHARAIELYERSVAVRRKSEPADSPRVLSTQAAIAAAYMSLSRYSEAEKLLLEVIAVQEKGGESRGLAISLNTLGLVQSSNSDHVRAEATYRRMLGMLERLQGKDHPDVAIALTNLANTFSAVARYDDALEMMQRSLAIKEHAFGADNIALATTLGAIAVTYDEMGLRAEALRYHERTYAVAVKGWGEAHANLGTVMQNMARSLREAGNYTRAIELFERATVIVEKTVGAKTDHMAIIELNLGDTFKSMGDGARAREHYQAALATYTAIGEHQIERATTLSGLAQATEMLGEDAAAERAHREAIELETSALGPNHTNVGFFRSQLAGFLIRHGRLPEALRELETALAIQRASSQPRHLRCADYLIAIGNVHFKLRDDAKAAVAYDEALALIRDYPGHPIRANVLPGQAGLHEARGEIAKAVALRAEAAAIREHTLAAMLAVGSEAQKLKVVDTMREETVQTLALNIQLAPRDPAATALALRVLLQRKGRALDAMVASLRGRGGADGAVLAELAKTRAELSAWVLRGPGVERQSLDIYRDRLALLTRRLDELEGKVGRGETRASTVDVASVQAAIPADAALIELVLHRDYDPRAAAVAARSGTARYVAYVLRPTGAPALVDLGPAAAIDDAIGKLRTALADPKSNVRGPARSLDRLVMQPVRVHLGDARRLIVAPDGALNLVPFAAFVDEDDRFLLDRYLITYATTGRDLLVPAPAAPRGPPVIVGAPDYAAAGGGPFVFEPLPGTADEARALGKLLPNARVAVGADASEPLVKGVAGPQILHVATHGFFLADGADALAPGTRGLARVRRTAATPTNPLMRSGIALAHANAPEGDSDGIVTALEVASLDLVGTKLVTFSACETGVGEIKTGDGVFGLRRALVVAGAETQVMSLWKVDDAATRDLMIGYYRALDSGRGRGEAMRDVQLAMRDRHPYFWASFIVSGNTSTLAGKPASPVQVLRGPRGCGCGASGDPSLAAIALGLVALLRRRRQ